MEKSYITNLQRLFTDFRQAFKSTDKNQLFMALKFYGISENE
jgi:hypothetical protein